MPLQLLPVEANDFDEMSSHVLNDGGDLSAPLLHRLWPITSDAAAMSKRTKWSMEQQREIFLGDPTVRFMKVVDTDRSNDIVSLARWHYYERGFPFPDNVPWELKGMKGHDEFPWPAEYNVPLGKAILTPLLEERPKWQGEGPMWVLTTLITRDSCRKRGAGTLLVKWGVEQAVKDKVPAFLEASILGEPVYRSCGFERVGEQTVDLSEFGIDKPMTLARMAANRG